MKPSLEVSTAIARLYQAFDHKSIKGPLHSGDDAHGIRGETELRLIDAPLRKISSADLSEYNNALTDCRGVSYGVQYRYFVPRMAELAALNDPPDLTHGLPLCLKNLGRLDWRRSWPVKEVAALDSFFLTFLRDRLAAIASKNEFLSTDPFELAAAMCFCVSAGSCVDGLLAEIDNFGEPKSLVLLALLRQLVAKRNGGYVLTYAYLMLYPEQAVRIADFAMRSEVDERIESSFLLVSSPGVQQLLSDALWPK